MNKNKRIKNRANARRLREHIRDNTVCPECGELGPHYVSLPMTLFAVVSGEVPQGFWTCRKFYDENGRRKEC